MKQVILFSELESKGARRTAWRLSKQGNLVYALAGKGEDIKEQGIFYVVSAFSTVNAALPLLRAGKGKRIAVLTEEKSSINLHRGEDDYAYQMSLASLNMMERILFNALRPEGFTFRNYAESEVLGGMDAELYFQSNLCYDANDAYIHSDENRLVMRNAQLCELPW